MEDSSLLETCSFLTIGTSAFVLKMLCDTDEMKAVPTREGSQVLIELGKANSAAGDLVQIFD